MGRRRFALTVDHRQPGVRLSTSASGPPGPFAGGVIGMARTLSGSVPCDPPPPGSRKRQLARLRRVDRLEQPIVKILDPLRTDRHLRIDDHDDLVERQAARLIFGQQRAFFGPCGLAAALEGVLADGLGARDDGLRGLADRLAQLLDGFFIRGRQVELHARVALQGAAGVLAIDFIEGGDGLGDHGQVTTIGPQGLDALDHDGHLAESD